jgi:hypothetical protein
MRCVRCGCSLPADDDDARVRLAVVFGWMPGPWRHDGHSPAVDLCRDCARAVALTIACGPLHRSGAATAGPTRP